MEAPRKITLTEAIRRIAYSRNCTQAYAAELVRADIELLAGVADLPSPPEIDPPAAKPAEPAPAEEFPLSPG